MASLTSAPTSAAIMPEPGDLLRVLEAVLAVGGAVPEPTDHPDQLRVQAVHADLEARPLPSSLRCCSISFLTLSTTSSIRAGWIRPSAMRRWSASLAISRRRDRSRR